MFLCAYVSLFRGSSHREGDGSPLRLSTKPMLSLERSASSDVPSSDSLSLLVTQGHLCTVQKADQALRSCFSNVKSAAKASGEKVAHLLTKIIW